MILKSLLIFTLVQFYFVFNPVIGQICTTDKLVRSTSLVNYTYSYKETYMANCWYGRCRKSKWKKVIRQMTIPKMEIKPVDECCVGYYNEDTETENGTINCKPICMPFCENGYCKSPGQCVCHDGYMSSSINPHSCSPVCSNYCEHGTCVGPDNCECSFGYVYTNGTCLPHCLHTCVNATCAAPDTCVCLDGYRPQNETNICKPYCSRGCDYGTCVSPEVCECDEGYIMINNNCRPVCDPECSNGMCTAPGKCTCDEDYELVNNICMPVCQSPCGNGTCVEPDTCECFDGYDLSSDCDPNCCKPKCTGCGNGTCYEPGICRCEPGLKNENGTCVPECAYDCVHGICVSPNVCECGPGYEYANNVCAPFCHNCEGNCIAPDTCICEDPFETKNVTIDGEDCDCFDNCSRKCEKTICFKHEPTEYAERQADINRDAITMESSDVATEEISVMHNDDKYVENYTVPFKEYYTSTTLKFNSDKPDERYERNDTIFDIISNKSIKQQDNKRVVPVWVYAVCIVLLLVLLSLTIIIILKRESISKYFRGGSYEVENYYNS